jgi:hypothetical protein
VAERTIEGPYKEWMQKEKIKTRYNFAEDAKGRGTGLSRLAVKPPRLNQRSSKNITRKIGRKHPKKLILKKIPGLYCKENL